MITYLQGTLAEKAPTRIVMEVAGVGYEVFVPLSSYDKLPSVGEGCKVLIHDYIREDTHTLYGFVSEADREMFQRLLSISGIGPKLALSALSGLTLRDFKSAVVTGDVKLLSSISGVGKKMAERMVVELKDKLTKGEAFEAVAGAADIPEGDVIIRDAVMALVSLGYKQADAWKMVQQAVKKLGEEATVEKVVRQSLIK